MHLSLIIKNNKLINDLINNALIDTSFNWLCKQRKHFPVSSDIWHCRYHWHIIKPQILTDLVSNKFNFQPLQKVIKSSGEVIHLWTSIDSLVLKMLSTVFLNTYLHLNYVRI